MQDPYKLVTNKGGMFRPDSYSISYKGVLLTTQDSSYRSHVSVTVSDLNLAYFRGHTVLKRN